MQSPRITALEASIETEREGLQAERAPQEVLRADLDARDSELADLRSQHRYALALLAIEFGRRATTRHSGRRSAGDRSRRASRADASPHPGDPATGSSKKPVKWGRTLI